MKSCRDCEKGGYCRSVVARVPAGERAGAALRIQITCQQLKVMVGIQNKVEGLALASRLPSDVVHEILSDGRSVPNLKLAGTFVKSMKKLDGHDLARQFRESFDPAWFNRAKINLQLARAMIERPEDYE